MGKPHLDHAAIADILFVEDRVSLAQPLGKSIENRIGMSEDHLPVRVAQTDNVLAGSRDEPLGELPEEDRFQLVDLPVQFRQAGFGVEPLGLLLPQVFLLADELVLL